MNHVQSLVNIFCDLTSYLVWHTATFPVYKDQQSKVLRVSLDCHLV